MTLLAQKRPVIFAGENHMITLFAAGSDQAIVSMSCWRCSYSAYGEGFVLFVWSDPPASNHLAANAIYSDNAALARMVATHFNQYFAGFDQRGFAEQAVSMHASRNRAMGSGSTESYARVANRRSNCSGAICSTLPLRSFTIPAAPFHTTCLL
jgi:hypothetical protein